LPCPRGIRCQYEQMPVVDLISTYFFFRQTISLRQKRACGALVSCVSCRGRGGRQAARRAVRISRWWRAEDSDMRLTGRVGLVRLDNDGGGGGGGGHEMAAAHA
jgi:hypothetical protein